MRKGLLLQAEIDDEETTVELEEETVATDEEPMALDEEECNAKCKVDKLKA